MTLTSETRAPVGAREDTLAADTRRLLVRLASAPSGETATLHRDEAVLLRDAFAELDRWRGLADAIRQIIGEPEGWPSHGNAPLAIAAKIQLLQIEVARTTRPRPLAEWSEDDGDVLWWRFPIEEPPYFGSPLCCGQTVEIEFRTFHGETVHRHQVGGWPGYHTHWTPISDPVEPLLPANESQNEGAQTPGGLAEGGRS